MLATKIFVLQNHIRVSCSIVSLDQGHFLGLKVKKVQ